MPYIPSADFLCVAMEDGDGAAQDTARAGIQASLDRDRKGETQIIGWKKGANGARVLWIQSIGFALIASLGY